MPTVHSFVEFFEAEQRRLRSAMFLVTGNLDDAEELVQEAFVRVLENWHRVCELDDATGYLYRTAMNVFRSRHRRARVALRRLPQLLRPAGDDFTDVEIRADVRRALTALTPRQRAAVVLTELLDHPVAEVAQMLRIQPSTVRALTTQGRAAMRKVLDSERHG